VAAACWWPSGFSFRRRKDTGAVKMGDKLFADLPVNAVASMTIADAENKVTLVKGDKVWQVEDRDGYPANFDEIRDTVVKLSRLKIGRSFSASPESLTRLSLLAPSASDTSGEGHPGHLEGSVGTNHHRYHFGPDRETGSGGSGGQYLKKADADTVFLVDGSFRFLKTAPAQWLKKRSWMSLRRGGGIGGLLCRRFQNPGLHPFTIAKGGSGTDDARPTGTNRRCGERLTRFSTPWHP
jgi:hypothetical protein